MSHTVFISLTHQDGGIAEAIREALRELFGEFLQVRFSTSKELEGGIQSGDDWFQWIVRQVEECAFALILITPSSVHKPWILWEAGAVAGAALASGGQGLRRVRPLVYQVPTDLIPSPIRDSKVQFRRGDTAPDFRALLREIMNDYKNELSGDRVTEFGEKLKGTLDTYMARVQACLQNAPAVASPIVIEEWRLRLDEVLSGDRASEVEHLQDWMDIAFGRSRENQSQPLDLRLHSRFADLYLRARKYERAIEQLELARQLAPRDIFILRTLGRAHLDMGHSEAAKTIMDRIEILDHDAFVHNTECAGLAGRWYRSIGNQARAEEIYRVALEANPRSYYLANLLAETRLDLGQAEAAGKAFRQALTIIEGLHENNVWTHATAANAAFFLDQMDTALAHLTRVVAARPTADEMATIERGLRAIAERLPAGSTRLEPLLAALHP